MITELLIFPLISLLIYYYYLHKKLHYHFAKCGLKFKPGVPIFGNIFWSTVGVTHTIDDLYAVYKEFPDEKYIGYMEGNNQIIMVNDPELIKRITIKDFAHFPNRKQFFPKEIEPLLGSSILNMKDNQWRTMRARLALAFTNSKLKLIFPAMTDTCNNIVEYLKEHQSEDVDVIDIMRRYAIDVSVYTTLGLHVNSVKDRDNEFYAIGKEAVHLSIWRSIHYFVTIQYPIIAKLMEFLGIALMTSKGSEFFKRLVAATMEYRKKNNVVRPDFIHLLTEDSQDWTMEEITGQIFFFFIASYESTAATLTMCIHEIALHPDYEERLYQEIKKHQDKYGKLTLDNVSELTFLDCVLNEASRKWSVALVMERICSKAYLLPPPREGGQEYLLRPGDFIYNSVNSVHMDPKYHPNPEIFNPDRFSKENEHKIKSFTFMPFGMGPRSCLGMRFATLQMKTIIYHLILNFRIAACEKTTYPIRKQSSDFIIRAVGETYVRCEARA